MRINPFLLLLILPICLHAQSVSTRGTEFWLGYMENRAVNDDSQFGLFISAEHATSGTIEVPATGLSIPFTVPDRSAVEVMLPRGAFNASGSEQIEGKGIVVAARDSITLAAVQYKTYFSDASIVLPTSRLGTAYIAIAAEDDATRLSPSELLVVASEANTTVEIIPSTLTRNLRPAGRPYTITLDRGEVYQLQAADDLTGTSIRSTNGRRFSLFGGAVAAAIRCPDDSHVYDQLLPVSDWDIEYITVPFAGRGGDLVKIVASENNTVVQLDCGPPLALGRGESLDTVLAAATVITATAPIGVAQFALGQSCGGIGGPSMLALEPLGRVVNRRIFRSPYHASGFASRPAFELHHLNLVARTADVGSITVDGAPAGSAFRPVPGDPRYSHATFTLDSGSHTLDAPAGVHAAVYGFGPYDAYTYSLGADLDAPPLSDSISFRVDIAGGRLSTGIGGACGAYRGVAIICAGSLLQFIADTVGFEGASWLWSFGDGTQGAGSRVSHTYDTSGEFEVRLLMRRSDCRIGSASTSVRLDECFVGLARRLSPRLGVTPNPARGAIDIGYFLHEDADVSIELFDELGNSAGAIWKGRERAGRHDHACDMSGRPSGRYLVQMRYNGAEATEWITKVE